MTISIFSALDQDTRSTPAYKVISTETDILDINDIINNEIDEDLDEAEENRILAMNGIPSDGLELQTEDWCKLTHQTADLPEGCHEIKSW
jgi:hypothetical protein